MGCFYLKQKAGKSRFFRHPDLSWDHITYYILVQKSWATKVGVITSFLSTARQATTELDPRKVWVLSHKLLAWHSRLPTTYRDGLSKCGVFTGAQGGRWHCHQCRSQQKWLLSDTGGLKLSQGDCSGHCLMLEISKMFFEKLIVGHILPT